MAFIWKAPASKFWQAGWRDENGRRRNKSTKLVAKESTRRKAERMADLFEEAANNRRTAKHLRLAVSELQREITGETLAIPFFDKFAEDFLEGKKGETGKATMAFYRTAVRDFSSWLGVRAGEEILAITSDDLNRYRNELQSKIAATTATNRLKALRAIFTAAVKRGFMDADPTSSMKFTRKNKAGADSVRKRAFTVPEMKAVLAEASGEWRSMILLGLYTGQRLGDLATLRWQSIDLEAGKIAIKTRKTGRDVTIPIAPPLAAHLVELKAPKDRMAFVHPELAEIYLDKGSPQVSNQFSNILAAAGLREKLSHRKTKHGRDGIRAKTELSFHCLRATAATLLHEAGIPAAVAQEFIGHDSEAIHKVYVKIGDQAIREASEALPNLLES